MFFVSEKAPCFLVQLPFVIYGNTKVMSLNGTISFRKPENAVCQYGNDYFPDIQLLQFQLEVFLLSKELLLPQYRSL